MGCIEVTRREAYGRTLYYPRNNEAHALSIIAGTTTLTEQVLELSRFIGCDVRIHAVPLAEGERSFEPVVTLPARPPASPATTSGEALANSVLHYRIKG